MIVIVVIIIKIFLIKLDKYSWKGLNSDVHISVPVSGGRPEGEDAEHGEVPANGHGHGASCCQEKPEQLEFAVPLVAVETTIWPREEPR